MSVTTWSVLGVLGASLVAAVASVWVARQGRTQSRESAFIDALLERIEQLNGRQEHYERRLGELESDLEKERRFRHLAVTYIRDLLRLLRVHSIDVPDPPTGLDL